jgi:hypothetical protein
MKKGLVEWDGQRGKGSVAIYWRRSGFSLCIQLIFFSPTFGLADSFSPLVALRFILKNSSLWLNRTVAVRWKRSYLALNGF